MCIVPETRNCPFQKVFLFADVPLNFSRLLLRPRTFKNEHFLWPWQVRPCPRSKRLWVQRVCRGTFRFCARVLWKADSFFFGAASQFRRVYPLTDTRIYASTSACFWALPPKLGEDFLIRDTPKPSINDTQNQVSRIPRLSAIPRA